MDTEISATPPPGSYRIPEDTKLEFKLEPVKGVRRPESHNPFALMRSRDDTEGVPISQARIPRNREFHGLQLIEEEESTSNIYYKVHFQEPRQHDIRFLYSGSENQVEKKWQVYVFQIDELANFEPEYLIRILKDILTLYTAGEISYKTASIVKNKLYEESELEDQDINHTLDEFTDEDY